MGSKKRPFPSMKGGFKATVDWLVTLTETARYELVSAADLLELLQANEPIVVVDCRDEDTYAFAHIPGAINCPHTRFEETLSEVPRGTPIVTACYYGMISKTAAQRLAGLGHERVLSLIGGNEAWYREGLPVESND